MQLRYLNTGMPEGGEKSVDEEMSHKTVNREARNNEPKLQSLEKH